MEILNSFMGQGVIAQIGEIVLFANTVTIAMPTRWKSNSLVEGTIMSILFDEDRLKDIPPPLKINPIIK